MIVVIKYWLCFGIISRFCTVGLKKPIVDVYGLLGCYKILNELFLPKSGICSGLFTF